MRSRFGILLFILAYVALPASASQAVGCPHRSDTYSKQVLADAPAAYYRLDEAAGLTLCDSSTSRNNGTYNASGIAYGVPGALATGDTAIAATGASGVVGQSGRAPSGLIGNHDFTLEAWFRNTESAPNNHVLVDIGQSCSAEVSGQSCSGVTTHNGQAAGLALFPHHNAQVGWGPSSGFGIDEFGADYVWDPGSLPSPINLWDGKWHYLVISYGHATNQLAAYIDGHNLGQPNRDPYGNPTFNIAAARIALGQWINTFHQPLVGDLDEVAVYRRALSASRVHAHWAAARGSSRGRATVTISSTKINKRRHTASVAFSAQGATGFQCELVTLNRRAPKMGFTRCSSPKTYKQLRAGKYKFEVRAVSSAGAGPAATRTFTI